MRLTNEEELLERWAIAHESAGRWRNKWDAAQARIASLEADLAALRDRRCGTCGLWRDEVCCNDGPLCAEFTGPGFGCSQWEARSPEETDTEGDR